MEAGSLFRRCTASAVGSSDLLNIWNRVMTPFGTGAARMARALCCRLESLTAASSASNLGGFAQSTGTNLPRRWRVGSSRATIVVSATLRGESGALVSTVSYTHLRAHETGRNLVCRLLLEK